MAGRKRSRADAGNNGTRKKPRRREDVRTTSRVTRLSVKRSVINVVFLTTELLENILHFLPMKDLLLAQRVCGKWKATIESSRELQQALFFAPAAPGFQLKLETEPKPKVEVTKVAASEQTGEGQNGITVYEPGQLNPLLLNSDGLLGDLMSRAWRAAFECIVFQGWPSTTVPEASWRKMLVTQPPIVSVYVERCFHDEDGDWFLESVGNKKISNPAGLSVWDLVEPVVKGEAKEEPKGGKIVMKKSCFSPASMLIFTGRRTENGEFGVWKNE